MNEIFPVNAKFQHKQCHVVLDLREKNKKSHNYILICEVYTILQQKLYSIRVRKVISQHFFFNGDSNVYFIKLKYITDHLWMTL